MPSSGASASDYALPPPPAVSTSTTFIDFQSDHFDYVSTSSVIHFKGHVLIHESTWTIKSDDLWLDTKERTGRSDGFILIEGTGTAAAAGTSGDFDFGKHTGRLNDTKAAYNQWRVVAKSVRLAETKTLDYRTANFTSCDTLPAHYHFHSTRLWVVPGDHFFARNVVFFIGRVPVFYTPFFYKSLKKNKYLRFKAQPGYDRRNGDFVKGTLLFDPLPNTYGKIYVDELSSVGVGHGFEIEHRDGSNRGVLYGYRIEESSGVTRWAALGEGYQVFRTSFSAQVRAQDQSDANFNNDYARSSVFRITPEIFNNGAVTYRLRKISLRLSYARHDVATETRHWTKTDESAPRLDFNTASLAVWRLPWLNAFSGYVDNTYLKGRSFIQRTANAGWEATRTFPVVKRVSFTPRVNYNQTWYNRIDEVNDSGIPRILQDVYVGRYTGQGTLRWRSLIGDLDLSHTWAGRQKADMMVRDAGANDHGVETNMSTLTDAIRPNRKILFRITSGFDYRIFRDHIVLFRDRVQPFVADVVLSPSKDFNLSLRDDYTLVKGNQAAIFSAEKGDILHSFVSAGFGYFDSLTTHYFTNVEFGYEPSSGTWRLTGAGRSEVLSTGGARRLSHVRLFEKELTLTKNWHDFYARAAVLFRPGDVREFRIAAELKFDHPNRKEARHRDWEAEWFPERAKPGVDRP